MITTTLTVQADLTPSEAKMLRRVLFSMTREALIDLEKIDTATITIKVDE